MTDLAPIPYSDAKIRSILERVKTIAMVGASLNWNRPSYFVMKYLQGKGYRVIPVNRAPPAKRCSARRSTRRCATSRTRSIWSTCSAPQAAPGVVADAIAIGAKVVWMQMGVRNDDAAATAEAAGIEVVMNRCPKIEFGRLGGELSWSGVNSGIIRNARRKRRCGEDEAAPRAPAKSRFGFETRAIHAGARARPDDRRAPTPIYQTTAYVFDDVDHAASLFNLQNFGYIYSRLTNPTVAVLEERVAALEGGRRRSPPPPATPRSSSPSSPHGAGRRIPRLAQALWRLGHPVRRCVQEVGWNAIFVDPADPENFRRALTPGCKAIFVESLANPGGVVVDLEPVAAIAHKPACRSSSTTPSPRPIFAGHSRWGADIVVHSTTKFLSGHGNSMGGVVVESGGSTGRRTAVFRRSPSRSRPITVSNSPRPSATSRSPQRPGRWRCATSGRRWRR